MVRANRVQASLRRGTCIRICVEGEKDEFNRETVRLFVSARSFESCSPCTIVYGRDEAKVLGLTFWTPTPMFGFGRSDRWGWSVRLVLSKTPTNKRNGGLNHESVRFAAMTVQLAYSLSHSLAHGVA